MQGDTICQGVKGSDVTLFQHVSELFSGVPKCVNGAGGIVQVLENLQPIKEVLWQVLGNNYQIDITSRGVGIFGQRTVEDDTLWFQYLSNFAGVLGKGRTEPFRQT